MDIVWVSLLNMLHTFSNVSIVNFEHVFLCWIPFSSVSIVDFEHDLFCWIPFSRVSDVECSLDVTLYRKWSADHSHQQTEVFKQL